MTAPDPTGFARFFRDVRDDDSASPFPWQERLARQVMATGEWPDVIDVPTGLGKTSMLDIAVYVLAASLDAPNAAARRRILFIVDRRLVVDEAYEHARRIANAIDTAPTDTLRAVRDRLARLRGTGPDDAEVLTVTRMRGGTTWDSNWVNRPDQPAIAVGTVDQLGSRMLFRGYATTDYRKPMDAALTGTDSLILVDEAHLAGTLLDTTRALNELDPVDPPLRPSTVVQLSATPAASGSRFEFDATANLEDPVARRRLASTKKLRLVNADPRRMPQALASLTAELTMKNPGARALVVCNTVSRARETHRLVTDLARRRKLPLPVRDGVPVEPELLIGRTRPFDRDSRIDGVLARFGVDRRRQVADTVDVLVATQTVEVGANLDVDILVTESASLSALVQRAGRLNRLGMSTVAEPIAVVVDDGADDPVYGDSRRRAWDVLVDRVGAARDLSGDDAPDDWPAVDANPLALRDLVSEIEADAFGTPSTISPIVTRQLIHGWARTSPRPEPDPPVAPYLHGIDHSRAPVTIIWRDDLLGTSDDPLTELPFSSAESIEVPFTAAIAWLTGTRVPAVADVDTADQAAPTSRGVDRQVFVRAVDGWHVRQAGGIRPGDVVAVPADWGGNDRYGWDPSSTEPVRDVRDLVSTSGRRPRPSLRIDTRTTQRIYGERHSVARAALDDAIAQLTRAELEAGSDPVVGDTGDALEPARDALLVAVNSTSRDPEANQDYRTLISRLVSGPGETEWVNLAGSERWLLRRPTGTPDIAGDGGPTDSSASRARVTLRKHHSAVGSRTNTICTALGLPDDLTHLLVLAAEYHDLGKIDPRFQAALADGSTFIAALLDEPLAKSGLDPRSGDARSARRRSGLPPRFRHEAWSGPLADQILAARLPDSWQRDLVRHLIDSHHGRARPTFEPVLDRRPQDLHSGTAQVRTESADSADPAAAARFARLNAHLGARGLALLETIVRSADQTCSAEGT